MKDSVALEVQEKAEFRCGLATLNNGQCSGQYVELHHVVYRSHGGGDEAENILPLCSRHHAAIHDRGKPLLEDKNGWRYYQLQEEDGFTRWYLFEDVKEELRQRAYRIHLKLQEAHEGITAYRYGAAVLCAEMEAQNLYTFFGYDSAVEYMMGELGEPASSCYNALRVGHFFRVNPHLLERVQESRLYFSAVKGSLAALKMLPGSQVEAVVDEMIAAQEANVPVESIVESVKEAAGRSSIWSEWDVTARVSATDSTLTLRVSAPSEAKAEEAFVRAAFRGGPVSEVVKLSTERVVKV